MTAPVGVLMPGCDPVQPDFLLIRRANAAIIHDRRVRGVPDLIAEVLLPSNPEQDLDTKRDAYARAGVPEYWVVRPETRDMLVFWEPDIDAGAYLQEYYAAADAVLQSPTLPIQLAIAGLFAGAPDTTL